MPGVYGVPEQWPHVSALYERAGFTHTGHTEIVYHAKVEDLRRPAEVPIAGLSLRRTVGMNGTRLSAMLGGDAIGYIEVEIFDAGERLSRNGGWADIGNLHVDELYRRRGVGAWLLRQAADWLNAAKRRPPPRLCLARRHRSWWPGLCGRPGIPPGGRVSGTDPDQARMEPCAAQAMTDPLRPVAGGPST